MTIRRLCLRRLCGGGKAVIREVRISLNYHGQRIMERVFEILFFICALASVAAVLLICVFLFAGGIPAMGEVGFFDFILAATGPPWTFPPPSASCP